MYNVTLFTESENKKVISKASKTFHPYILDYNYSSYFKPKEFPPLDKWAMKAHENKIMADFVNFSEDNRHTLMMADLDFKAGISVGLGFEPMLFKRFNIPHLKWLIFLPDPMISMLNRHPWDVSTNLPLVYPARDAMKVQGFHHSLQHRLFGQVFP